MLHPKITIQKTELLSNNWYVLNKVTFDYKMEDHDSETQVREVYDLSLIHI
jgi:GDP-mannose pyrophosphatase NudK